MTEDLDQLLGRLAHRAAHPRLDAVSQAVLDQVAATPMPRRDTFLLTSAVAAMVAVGIGVAGGLAEPARAHATGLDAGMALAPSTLLGGG